MTEAGTGPGDQATNRCSKGHMVAAEAAFCSTCGEPLRGPEAEATPSKTRVSRRTMIAVGMLVVVAALIPVMVATAHSLQDGPAAGTTTRTVTPHEICVRQLLATVKDLIENQDSGL